MTKVISIVNFKGGVSKTTTSISFAYDLYANHKKKVLLIDLDPQANIIRSLGIDYDKIKMSISDVLVNPDIKISDIVIKVEDFHIAPSTISLAITQKELQSESLGELRLKEKLTLLINDGIYDYIIIDTPPTLGLILDNALLASHEYIVPIDTGYLALVGVAELLKYIEKIKKHNSGLKFAGVLATMVDNTNMSGDVISLLKEKFKTNFFKTQIKRRVKIKEAPTQGKPIHIYDEASAIDYINFTKEYLTLGV